MSPAQTYTLQNCFKESQSLMSAARSIRRKFNRVKGARDAITVFQNYGAHNSRRKALSERPAVLLPTF